MIKNPIWVLALLSILLLLAACSMSQLAPTPSLPPSPIRSTTASEPVTVSSPVQPIKFDRISLEQGLSQSTINCILQDRYGFMWFGTQDGLNRYDGYNFTVYRHVADDPNSLSANYVWSLYEDKDGALWIATDGGGLDRFDRDTGKFAHYQAGSTPDTLTTNFIRVVYQDRAGMLWVCIPLKTRAVLGNSPGF